MIRRSVRTALVALLAASATPALAQYGSAAPAAPRPTPSSTAPAAPAPAGNAIKPSQKAVKALVELQKAVQAKDTANIPAKVAAAQAVASTKEDRYLIARLQLDAAIAANDNATAASAVDAVAASGVLDQAGVGRLYKGMGGSFYNAKQYDRAIASFNKAISLNPNDIESLDLIAESQLGVGNKAAAAAAFQRAIQARSSSGQKPPEETYKKAVQLAYDAHAANAADIARSWVAAYPSPDSWHNTVAIYRNLNRPDVEGTLDLLRLLRANNALTSSGDYALYVEGAAEQLNYNEAQAVLNAGIAAKAVDPSNAQFRDMISVLKSKPKATAADLAAASKMSPSAMNLLRIGDRYYGMGNYAQAASVYRDVMGKPGADKDLANLHLGMALAAAGDKAGAATAFNAVSGPRSDIAKLWLLYVQNHA